MHRRLDMRISARLPCSLIAGFIVCFPTLAEARRESHFQLMAQPISLLPNATLYSFSAIGLQGELNIGDSPWGVGVLHHRGFSYANIPGLPAHQVSLDRPHHQAIWGRYSLHLSETSSLGLMVGWNQSYELKPSVQSSNGSNSPEVHGVLAAMSYRHYLDRFWVQVTPQYVFPLTQADWINFGRSGLSWLEIGVRLGHVDLSVRPVSRAFQASIVF